MFKLIFIDLAFNSLVYVGCFWYNE